MNHDCSQSNSISCVRGGSVGITEVFVACDYPRAAVGIIYSRGERVLEEHPYEKSADNISRQVVQGVNPWVDYCMHL